MNRTLDHINQAIDYIRRNMDRELTVEEIADVCCFSRFYFNRLFKSITGEGVYGFLRRLRLERGAYRLMSSPSKTITEIALEAGYSPSNFASAFKEQFGVSASEFRKRGPGDLQDVHREIRERLEGLLMNEKAHKDLKNRVQVRYLNSMILEYRRVIGYYGDLIPHWSAFCKDMAARYGDEDTLQFIGISYDDPIISDESRCMYDLCVVADRVSGSCFHRLEAGEYGCYGYCGPVSGILNAYQELCGLWLPFSGYELDNRLPLEFYYPVPEGQEGLNMEICFPVRRLGAMD